MVREEWILADLLVGDPIQGGRVCKSDVNDLTPVVTAFEENSHLILSGELC